MSTVTDDLSPAIGALVEVRGRRWVVSEVEAAVNTLVELQSVEDGRYGDTLDVIWEVEPGRRVLPSGSLPEVTEREFDPPERLAAFLDAVRWARGHLGRRQDAAGAVPLRRRDRGLPARAGRPRRRRARGSTCCSPTTSASARPSRPAWSPRSCCCATAPGAS